MIKVILFVLILILAWYGNRQFQHKKFVQEAEAIHKVELTQQNKELDNVHEKAITPIINPKAPSKPVRQRLKYKCDGRKHCSQMGSYEEAKFFLDNCPNTRMDGDDDGIPCERQFKQY